MRLNVLLVALLVASLAPASDAAASRRGLTLDPRLAPALAADAAPVSVWVEFVDKGEQGPADLQRRLAIAERALTPECRARRVRARVTPLVDERDLPVDPAYLDALRARGLAPRGVSRWLNACAVEASGARLAAIAELGCVARLSPVPTARVRPTDPPAAREFVAKRAAPADAPLASPGFYGQTYTQLARLGIPALHDSGYVGTGIRIAVFDDGFNFYGKHTATRDIDVFATRDFVRGGDDVQDTLQTGACGSLVYFSHGQWTLSCLGGNAPGVYVGPAYGASFALARTENDCIERAVEMTNWLLAAEWADSLGADLVSSSVGYYAFPDDGTSLTYDQLDGHTSVITRAAEIAAAKGIAVVNSAGNDGPSARTLDVPADANGDSVLAVGAIDSLGAIANFSSRGPTADGRIKPDVTAQGVRVLVASASGFPDSYVRNSGTSFSCPLVAGAVACMLQARPAWTPVEVLRAIRLSASCAMEPDNDYGWGSADASRATFGGTGGWCHGDTDGGPHIVLSSANPARIADGVRVAFGVPEGGDAFVVSVHDVTGRLVTTLARGTASSGSASLTWDGRDHDGRRVNSGLYFVSIKSGGRRATVRVALLR